MKCQMKNTTCFSNSQSYQTQIPKENWPGYILNFSKKYYTEMISKSNNVPLKLLHKLLTSHLPDTPQSAYSIVWQSGQGEISSQFANRKHRLISSSTGLKLRNQQPSNNWHFVLQSSTSLAVLEDSNLLLLHIPVFSDKSK